MSEYLSQKQKRVHWNIPFKSSQSITKPPSPSLTYYRPRQHRLPPDHSLGCSRMSNSDSHFYRPDAAPQEVDLLKEQLALKDRRIHFLQVQLQESQARLQDQAESHRLLLDRYKQLELHCLQLSQDLQSRISARLENYLTDMCQTQDEEEIMRTLKKNQKERKKLHNFTETLKNSLKVFNEEEEKESNCDLKQLWQRVKQILTEFGEMKKMLFCFQEAQEQA